MKLPRTPSTRLDHRRALVTGAGRGIGVAAAAALAEQGAEVILTARTDHEIGAVAQAIRNAGGRAQAVSLDVTDAAACDAFFRAQGVFDVLVNNAGMNRPAPLMETSDASIEEVFSLNVLAAYRIARGVAVGLIAAGRGGSIINMSSQMGHVGGPNRTVYCGTKHAIEGMTKALAWELGPQQIRVNTLCPTFIETPMTSPMLHDEFFRQRVVERIALGRIGTVEDVMGGIVFLASSASALVTGSALMIDGGWTAQ